LEGLPLAVPPTRKTALCGSAEQVFFHFFTVITPEKVYCWDVHRRWCPGKSCVHERGVYMRGMGTIEGGATLTSQRINELTVVLF
jgi:hypothetical protein